MPQLTPEFAGNTLLIMLIGYIITLAYSVYMAILNYRQAKVKDLVIKTNEILEKILKEVKNG